MEFRYKNLKLMFELIFGSVIPFNEWFLMLAFDDYSNCHQTPYVQKVTYKKWDCLIEDSVKSWLNLI